MNDNKQENIKMPACNNEGFRCVRSTNNENPVERNQPTSCLIYYGDCG